MDNTMYIKKIVIENIRCFEHIESDLSSQQGTKMWTLILGDNGISKTTILRCIAMALMGATKASGLLGELYGEWVRVQAKEPKTAFVRIEFEKDVANVEPRWIKTTFERTKAGNVNVSQETCPENIDNFPWNDIFVCGYGSARRAYGSQDYDEYSAVESLYTLFNYNTPLQNAELIIRRIKDIGVEPEELLSWIDKILMLPGYSTKLELTGIVLSGPWGKFIPLGAMGDGHQATLAWLTDMLGWALFHDKDLFKKTRNELAGIVLIDEIEHHLHPSWQKQIIKLLSEQFPNIQFIASTHAPLCAVGSTYLSDDECSLVLLQQEDDHVRGYDKLLPPREKRADQVLTSYLFGLDTSGDDKIKAAIKEYSDLAGKRRNSAEELEYKKLFDTLENKLGTQETELEQIVSDAISEALSKNKKAKKYNDKALDFEIKRQLEELLKRS